MAHNAQAKLNTIMKKDPKKIIAEIMVLLHELAELAGSPIDVAHEIIPKLPPQDQKSKTGATGGVRLLVEEGKLDAPIEVSEIIGLLSQAGRHYSNQTVSMGLLNLVRERVLTRLKNNENGKWKYVVRR